MNSFLPKRHGLRLAASLVSVSLLMGGCGGGSSGGAPGSSPVFPSLSFKIGAISLNEGVTAFDVEVVLTTDGEPLAEALTVEIVDSMEGTAIPGQDYSMAPVSLITFPAGSKNGAVEGVDFDLIEDHLVEGTIEDVIVHLESPSAGSIGEFGVLDVAIMDLDRAKVRFVAPESGPFDELAETHSIRVGLELESGVELGLDVMVSVQDLLIGSATPGIDYTVFPSELLAFPAGSADGATHVVEFSTLPDAEPEINETVVLGLVAPSMGVDVSDVITHVLTIQDDDGTGAVSMAATEGETGLENPLVFEQTLDLGTKIIGSETDVSTHLRFTNTGATAMALQPPKLVGGASKDFSIHVESAGFSAADESSTSAGVHDMFTPLTVRPLAGGPGLTLELDRFAVAELESFRRVRLIAFPLPELGDVTVELERMRLPVAPDAVLFVDGEPVEGGLRGALAGLSVWRGRILEMPGSSAFIAFSKRGPEGFFELPIEGRHLVHLYSEADPERASGVTSHLLSEARFLELGGTRPPAPCQGVLAAPGGPLPSLDLGSIPMSAGVAPTVSDCRLAIETDFQLYERFGSTVDAASYITQLIAAISDPYLVDVQTTLSIAYLGLYSSPKDPWTTVDDGGDMYELLDEFTIAWGKTGWPVDANLAHFLSGAFFAGGVSYLDALCSKQFGYAVSGGIGGYIDWSTWSGEPGQFTWDFVVVAHELGHSFGANHTHDYCPPLDTCASNCTGKTECSPSTLMSYCYMCGGLENIDLHFHPMLANIMRKAVAKSCLDSATLGPDDFIQYRVAFDPLSVKGQRTTTFELTHDATNLPSPFRVYLQGEAE
jgi:hypothetical protein